MARFARLSTGLALCLAIVACAADAAPPSRAPATSTSSSLDCQTYDTELATSLEVILVAHSEALEAIEEWASGAQSDSDLRENLTEAYMAMQDRFDVLQGLGEAPESFRLMSESLRDGTWDLYLGYSRAVAALNNDLDESMLSEANDLINSGGATLNDVVSLAVNTEACH